MAIILQFRPKKIVDLEKQIGSITHQILSVQKELKQLRLDNKGKHMIEMLEHVERILVVSRQNIMSKVEEELLRRQCPLDPELTYK